MPEREVYIPLPIPPDAARDARVAARRAADARKAGRALDEMQAEGRWRDVSILSHEGQVLWLAGYDRGYADAHRQCEQQHNGHYGVPPDPWGDQPWAAINQDQQGEDPECE